MFCRKVGEKVPNMTFSEVQVRVGDAQYCMNTCKRNEQRAEFLQIEVGENFDTQNAYHI